MGRATHLGASEKIPNAENAEPSQRAAEHASATLVLCVTFASTALKFFICIVLRDCFSRKVWIL